MCQDGQWLPCSEACPTLQIPRQVTTYRTLSLHTTGPMHYVWMKHSCEFSLHPCVSTEVGTITPPHVQTEAQGQVARPSLHSRRQSQIWVLTAQLQSQVKNHVPSTSCCIKSHNPLQKSCFPCSAPTRAGRNPSPVPQSYSFCTMMLNTYLVSLRPVRQR